MKNEWFVITNEHLLAHAADGEGSKPDPDTPPAPRVSCLGSGLLPQCPAPICFM